MNSGIWCLDAKLRLVIHVGVAINGLPVKGVSLRLVELSVSEPSERLEAVQGIGSFCYGILLKRCQCRRADRPWMGLTVNQRIAHFLAASSGVHTRLRSKADSTCAFRHNRLPTETTKSDDQAWTSAAHTDGRATYWLQKTLRPLVPH